MNIFPINEMQNIGATRAVYHLTHPSHISSTMFQKHLYVMPHQQSGVVDRNRMLSFFKNTAFYVAKPVKSGIRSTLNDGVQLVTVELQTVESHRKPSKMFFLTPVINGMMNGEIK